MPQGVSSGGADAFDVVQDGFGISLIRPFPVVGNDETVGFVANELEELEGRFVMIQNDGVFGTFHVDFLDSLGQANDRGITAGVSDGGQGGMKLSQAAIQNDKVRCGPVFSFP